MLYTLRFQIRVLQIRTIPLITNLRELASFTKSYFLVVIPICTLCSIGFGWFQHGFKFYADFHGLNMVVYECVSHIFMAIFLVGMLKYAYGFLEGWTKTWILNVFFTVAGIFMVLGYIFAYYIC